MAKLWLCTPRARCGVLPCFYAAITNYEQLASTASVLVSMSSSTSSRHNICHPTTAPATKNTTPYKNTTHTHPPTQIARYISAHASHTDTYTHPHYTPATHAYAHTHIRTYAHIRSPTHTQPHLPNTHTRRGFDTQKQDTDNGRSDVRERELSLAFFCYSLVPHPTRPRKH